MEPRPTILRVKRKREDEAADVIILQTDGAAPARKRPAAGVGELTTQVAQAAIDSTASEQAKSDKGNGTSKAVAKKKLVFKRLASAEESRARGRDYSQQLLDRVYSGA